MKNVQVIFISLFLLACTTEDESLKGPVTVVLNEPPSDTEKEKTTDPEPAVNPERVSAESSDVSEYPFCQDCEFESCPFGGACVFNQQTSESFCSQYCGSSKDCPGSMMCLYFFPKFICVPFFLEKSCEESIILQEKTLEPEGEDTTLGKTDKETLNKIEEWFPLCQFCGEETLFSCDGDAACLINSTIEEQFCATTCIDELSCPEGFSCSMVEWETLCVPNDLEIKCVDNF